MGGNFLVKQKKYTFARKHFLRIISLEKEVVDEKWLIPRSVVAMIEMELEIQKHDEFKNLSLKTINELEEKILFCKEFKKPYDFDRIVSMKLTKINNTLKNL